ncbi:dna primase small subunit [Holotrichia oblita]|uniref:Dna primase small subunit n=1 Tax=Holotrichia oblita TaxID=644536 RepID=A0ACB9SZ26_HOLOL|nr:dna primase small subunit [Holotrichia oblita]
MLKTVLENESRQVFAEEQFQQALHIYYEKLYPFKTLFKWLSYGDPLYILKREIAFTTLNDRYIRHKSFQSEEDFQQYIFKKNPAKIDIGAVCHVPPRDYAVVPVCRPIEKELVFDIDINDYNEVRTCCKETDICPKCWKFICLACKILERILIEDFGFKHLLWVFSGRRGVHCWVSDKVARQLSNEERCSILAYINLIKGNTNVQRKVHLPSKPLHSSVQRALEIITKNFIDFIIIEQDILNEDNNGLHKFLKLLWDCRQNEFKQVMSKCKTSIERWNAFVIHLNLLQKSNCLPNKLKYLKEEIMLHYTYPRLDMAVTQSLDHLLKAPFCIHAKTGKVCIPFRVSDMDKFNVIQVPTLSVVLDELNNYYQKQTLNNHFNIYKSDKNFECNHILNTSLCDSYNILLNFVMELEL